MRKTASLIIILTLVTSAAHAAVCQHLLVQGEKFELSPHLASTVTLPQKSGLDLYWHRNSEGQTQLMALLRDKLLLYRIDPLSGEVISERALNGTQRRRGSYAVHSTGKGEFLVASARWLENDQQTIDIYSDADHLRLEIDHDIPGDTKKITWVESNDNLFLITHTANWFGVFRRDKNVFKLVGDPSDELDANILIRNLEVLQDKDGQMLFAVHTANHKIDLYKMDTDFEDIEKLRSFSPSVGKVSGVVTQKDDVIFAATETSRSTEHLRFYLNRQKVYSPEIKLGPSVGEHTWIRSGEQFLFAVPTRISKTDTRIRLFNPHTQAVEEVRAGDAKVISQISSLSTATDNFLIFNRDNKLVGVRGKNAETLIPAPSRTQLRHVLAPMNLSGSTVPAIAVLGEGPKGSTIEVWRLFE